MVSLDELKAQINLREIRINQEIQKGKKKEKQGFLSEVKNRREALKEIIRLQTIFELTRFLELRELILGNLNLWRELDKKTKKRCVEIDTLMTYYHNLKPMREIEE